MSKNKIGFKASLKEENHESEENNKAISPAEIEEQVKDSINAEHEYEEHMMFHHKLIQQNRIFKWIFLILALSILLYGVYIIGYYKGAFNQIKNNEPYKKIISTNGQEYILK